MGGQLDSISGKTGIFASLLSRILETVGGILLLEYPWVISDEEITRIGKALAEALKNRREKQALSKNALAQKAGVSVQSVSFIEDGVNSPSVSTLLRLCDALETTPEKIFKEARKAD